MEVKSVDDVEREKRETKEVGEEGGGGGCNRRHVDAAAAAAGLRVTGDGGKVSETRRKVHKQPQKVNHTGWVRGAALVGAVLVHFINEQGSVSG